MKKIFGILFMVLFASSSMFASKVYIIIDKGGVLQSLSLEKTKGAIEVDLQYNAKSQIWSMTYSPLRESSQPTSIIVKDNMLLPPLVLRENNLIEGGFAKGTYKSRTDSGSALTIVINLICWKCPIS